MTLREVADRFHAKPDGKGYRAKCPAHNDPGPSLEIDSGSDGRVLIKCMGGCDTDAVLAAVGLTIADLFPERAEVRPEPPRVIVATYGYYDEGGTLLYEAVRYSPKTFRQRQPDGRGGYQWSMNGARRVLYRLPELQGKPAVFVVEGEKDADTLWSLDVPATTNIGGAGKWDAAYVSQLQDAGVQRVYVLPDNDPAGLTHGRQVADACERAGLAVRLVPLPDLAPKGDVSDYLAAHTKGELLRVVTEAPLYDPTRSVAAEVPLTLTSLADLLSKPVVPRDDVVEDRIPAGSVTLFVAPPKTGKSTATRSMALAVATGQDWIGHRTRPGPTWLIALEDQESEVKAHFHAMGATGGEPVAFFIGAPGPDLIAHLHQTALVQRPRLIIVDHLGLVLKAKDFNDYAQVTERFAPLLAIARGTGAALVLIFHASTHQQRHGLDAVLGSTAIAASVDNVIVMKQDEGTTRVIESVQRIGPSLEPTIIELNKTTGWFQPRGTKRLRDAHALGDRMMATLREVREPLTEDALHGMVVGRKAEKVATLRKLVHMRWIVRLGAGGRHDPYRYTVPELVGPLDTSPEVPEVPAGSSLFPDAPDNTREPQEPKSLSGTREKNPEELVRTYNPTPVFDPDGWKH